MRVAVTGIGALSPVGNTASETWTNLLAGRSGVARLAATWAEDLPVRIAGTVNPRFAALGPVEARRMDSAEQLGVVAGREAWAAAGVPAVEPERLAVVVGTAIGGLHTTLEQQARLLEAGPRRVSPHTVTRMMANGTAGWLSMDLRARAGARTPVSACASGSEAILMAREMILAGSADVVLAGGTDACVTGLTLSALAQTKALSRNPDAEHASRPFDRGGDGFVLGEGAGDACAGVRGPGACAARPDLRLRRGCGRDLRRLRPRRRGPDNQARTITLALRSAGTAPEVDFVHAHATRPSSETSTKAGRSSSPWALTSRSRAPSRERDICSARPAPSARCWPPWRWPTV